MKSSFCNIFDEKKGVTSLVLLQKCAIFANRQLAYGLWENQKIKKFVCITTMKWQ